MSISQENKDQNDFVENLRIYKMEKSQTMHLLENAIYNDVFLTLQSHSYNLKNCDPKVLMDILSKVFTKITTCSIQIIGQELFVLNASKFDSLRYYLNRAMYLKERVNNIDLDIIDKFI